LFKKLRNVNSEKAVIDELTRSGCREFIVCGGARNAGLVALLKEAQGLQVWQHFEERGAAFFALGRTKLTSEPCAVVVTSGTAVAECFPAVIEAFYSCKPLIVISADRPERYQGTGAPQTIDQKQIFGEYAARELGDWCGLRPLHLNIELEEEIIESQRWNAEVGSFHQKRESFEVGALRHFLEEGFFRGVLVMVGGLESEDREEVYYFLKELGVPVIADPQSGIREALGHLVVSERVFKTHLPGKVLRLGEVPTGRFWRDLDDQPQIEVLSICRNGLPGLARESQVIRSAVGRVLRGFGDPDSIGDVNDDFLRARALEAKREELLESHPDSEPGLVKLLSIYATTGESLFLGNSLPIREWQEFAQRELPYAGVMANRGANGIDGQLSTWLGATAEMAEAWGVFGDLTTLYDLAAPSMLPQVQQRGRVAVVINNSGGRIFERLPRLKNLSQSQRDGIIQNQKVDLEAFARMWGMDYLKISAREDFDEFTPGERTLLIEMIPDAKETEKFWEAWSVL